ncbi:hypothetical protein GCM10027036_24740 [Flavihumibacter cheonanensis]|jgi:hypothetical protein|uniref:hypothetical protein n=1 Tax=Flavihumibacter cheonanensis TaxID=1442385 RepID=UPI001EF75BCF|nr:hypothetical protein [Flavihumibacter cheonanensis]MCG7754600.1 hypothetical protein [Flavihumibacter cheonanensis]
MKTSNKLLVILLINLVLIPTTIMLALSAKVNSGNYVLGMTEMEKEARAAKPISNTGLLKLTAPIGTKLECTIHYSDSVYYRKYGSANERLSVENSGDTLVFSLPASAENSQDEERNEIYLDLFMPFNGLLMLDGATAKLDSVAADAEIEVAMQNNSILTLGNRERDKNTPLKFASLFVQANNSDLTIPDRTFIEKLVLKLDGQSKLAFGQELQLANLEGTISGETSVTGPAKWFYLLKPAP